MSTKTTAPKKSKQSSPKPKAKIEWKHFVWDQDSDDLRDAKANLVMWEAMRKLASDNTLAAHIEIAGLSLGVCDNKQLIVAIDHNIAEVKKFIAGKPNKWN